ncbi:MAG: DUF1269 domain-containing protein, partial [Anaerolineae bacterium]|nr:DUF1269 domain-containing protein [Anaerolineae bacterium]
MAEATTYMLVLGVFDGVDKAQEHQDFLRQAQSRAFAASKSVGQIQCDAQGKVHIKETGDAGFAKGAVAGGTAAAAASLLFPPSALVLGAAGALVGGLGAKIKDGGIPDKQLKAFGKSFTPGSSGLVFMVEPGVVQEAEAELAALGSTAIHSYSLDGIELVGARPEAENAAAEAML